MRSLDVRCDVTNWSRKKRRPAIMIQIYLTAARFTWITGTQLARFTALSTDLYFGIYVVISVRCL